MYAYMYMYMSIRIYVCTSTYLYAHDLHHAQQPKESKYFTMYWAASISRC